MMYSEGRMSALLSVAMYSEVVVIRSGVGMMQTSGGAVCSEVVVMHAARAEAPD